MITWKHRYSILGILFSAWLLCYLDRMVMATAMPFIAKDLHLSPLITGEVLSAFFAGYALMQIPGGLLADRFGPRSILTISTIWWSLSSALTGMASGLTALLTIRLLFGLGEGPFPSAAAKALSNWFPRREVGRANGLRLASTAIGAAAAPLYVAALIEKWGWRSVFYFLFVPGIAIAAVICRYVRNSPAESRHVKRQELAEYDTISVQQITAKASLLESLKTPAVLWCAVCAFLSYMTNWGLMNWLPSYLLQARGFSIWKMGAFAALINLAAALGYPLGGYVCDKYFAQQLRIPIILGSLASGCFIYLAARASTGNWACVYLFMVFLSMNAAAAAISTLPMVAVPKRTVGGAFGIVNTAGQLAGLCSPLAIGYVLDVTASNFEAVLFWLVGLSFAAILPALQIRQVEDPVGGATLR